MKTTRRNFVATAVVLGAAAPLAGSPYTAQRGAIDVAELARLVASRDDHVDAIELAAWIRERRAELRIIDLRPSDAFETVSIPGAENVSIESLTSLPLRAKETIVLYGEGGAHAAQAWVFLHALGHRKVYFLAGGIHEWVDEVLDPVLAIDATDRERKRFEIATEFSRYFGGNARIGVPRAEVAARAVQLKRRGC